jgi:hypothetical protein
MKPIHLILLFILLCPLAISGLAQVPDHDAALAAQLGADGYGMKKYVLAFLLAGG